MKLTIHAYSTALFSSWFFLEELGVLFDCGDGCVAHLLQKSRKVKHIFISHPDRDHLGGLLQFNQLNGRSEYPKLYYPADSSTFPFLHSFAVKFDPHVKLPDWQSVRAEEWVDFHSDYSVKCIRNEHVASDLCKSLSFIVYRKKKKLKPCFQHLKGHELAELRESTEITESQWIPVLAYSADTPVETDGRWNGIPVLIHEATFLKASELNGDTTERNKHSSLEELIPMVKKSRTKHLILSHFSSRYSEEEIQFTLAQLLLEHDLTIAVSLILPGKAVVVESAVD